MDFGAIITWLQSIWRLVWIFTIVRQYEEGVIFTFGKYTKSIGPGLHFKWSFCQEILTMFAKDDTILLPVQKLTTIDGVTITVRGNITYYIDDIESMMTKVNAPLQAISDMSLGVIADNIITGTYEDCHNNVILNQINIDIRHQARKWGAYIVKVKFTDICKSKTINLTKDTESHL